MSQVNISIFDLLIENQEKSNFESTPNEIENNNELNDDQKQMNYFVVVQLIILELQMHLNHFY